MSITQQPQDVLRRSRAAVPGNWASNSTLDDEGGGLNSSPLRSQVDTVTVTQADAGSSYRVVINNITVEFATSAAPAPSTADVATLLAAAIEGDLLVRGQVRAEAQGAIVVLTALTGGLAFTLSSPDAPARLTLASVTSAQSPIDVPFARAIGTSGHRATEPERLVHLLTSDNYIAQVLRATVGTVGGSTHTARVVDGEGRAIAEASFADGGSGAANAAGLAAALNGALPATTVLASTDADALVLTAETAGYEFDVVLLSTDGAMSFDIEYTTGPDPSTSIGRSFVGVSKWSDACEELQRGGEVQGYFGATGVRYGKRGELWVDLAASEVIQFGGQVYVDMTPGTTAGRMYALPGAGRLPLPRDLVSWGRKSTVLAENASTINLRVS